MFFLHDNNASNEIYFFPKNMWRENIKSIEIILVTLKIFQWNYFLELFSLGTQKIVKYQRVMGLIFKYMIHWQY